MILFIPILAFFVCVRNSEGHYISVKNNCKQTLWIGTHGDDHTPLNGGFKLDARQERRFNVPHGWTSGRVWARTGCDNSGRNCETGDCGAGQCNGRRTTFDPVTLAEFGLDKYMELDFWDISLVDGFNLPIAIRPIPGTVQTGEKKCKPISCNFNFGVCPKEFITKGRAGKTVACKSACSATREDKYCCPEPKYNRQTCPQPSDYSRIFKKQCPDAYSYAYDDETSLFACKSSSPDSSSYQVIFCP